MDDRDAFRDLKKLTSEERAERRASSVAALRASGIRFVSKAGGVHLIVGSAPPFVHFWPATELWVSRGGKRGVGVESLLAYISDSQRTTAARD